MLELGEGLGKPRRTHRGWHLGSGALGAQGAMEAEAASQQVREGEVEAGGRGGRCGEEGGKINDNLLKMKGPLCPFGPARSRPAAELKPPAGDPAEPAKLKSAYTPFRVCRL